MYWTTPEPQSYGLEDAHSPRAQVRCRILVHDLDGPIIVQFSIEMSDLEFVVELSLHIDTADVGVEPELVLGGKRREQNELDELCRILKGAQLCCRARGTRMSVPCECRSVGL